MSRELAARFGESFEVACFRASTTCSARTTDGTIVPILLTRHARRWDWEVVGLVLPVRDLEVYLRAELRGLGATAADADRVACGARLRVVQPGDRITCEIAGGGAAFATVREDGSTAIEVLLDADAARARAEIVTPERDDALVEQSRALETTEITEEDDDASAPADPDPRPDPR